MYNEEGSKHVSICNNEEGSKHVSICNNKEGSSRVTREHFFNPLARFDSCRWVQ